MANFISNVTTIPVFRNTVVASGTAGGTSNSDPIDLREFNRQNRFSLSYRVGQSGTAATAATHTFKYLLSGVSDGTYCAPVTGDGGTIGTAGSGAAGSLGFIGFTPVVAPFMKIQCIVGTSGSGNSNVSAELHVQ